MSARLQREERTLEAMVALFCRGRHGQPRGLCAPCVQLLAYAKARLSRCPFGEGKTPCARCPVHCYRPSDRERMREVMRYAGPRMVFRHPVLAWLHFVDGFRKEEGGRRPE